MINNNNGNQNVPSKDYRINGSKVTIHKNNNSISFQFTYQGKRYNFGANLNWYSIPDHLKAQSIAQQIHNDCFIYGTFEGKEKYQGNKQKKNNIITLPEVKEFTLNDCFEFYLGKVDLGNTEKTRINKLLSTKVFTIDKLPDFVELALKTYKKSTLIRDLETISASINLAKTYKKHNQENLASDLIETLE